jgi:hypothetical protein
MTAHVPRKNALFSGTNMTNNPFRLWHDQLKKRNLSDQIQSGNTATLKAGQPARQFSQNNFHTSLKLDTAAKHRPRKSLHTPVTHCCNLPASQIVQQTAFTEPTFKTDTRIAAI